jgi:hypothetical protein
MLPGAPDSQAFKNKNGSHKARAERDEYGLGAGGPHLRFVCGYAEESCGRHPFDSGPSHMAELDTIFFCLHPFVTGTGLGCTYMSVCPRRSVAVFRFFAVIEPSAASN